MRFIKSMFAVMTLLILCTVPSVAAKNLDIDLANGYYVVDWDTAKDTNMETVYYINNGKIAMNRDYIMDFKISNTTKSYKSTLENGIIEIRLYGNFSAMSAERGYIDIQYKKDSNRMTITNESGTVTDFYYGGKTLEEVQAVLDGEEAKASWQRWKDRVYPNPLGFRDNATVFNALKGSQFRYLSLDDVTNAYKSGLPLTVDFDKTTEITVPMSIHKFFDLEFRPVTLDLKTAIEEGIYDNEDHVDFTVKYKDSLVGLKCHLEDNKANTLTFTYFNSVDGFTENGQSILVRMTPGSDIPSYISQLNVDIDQTQYQGGNIHYDGSTKILTVKSSEGNVVLDLMKPLCGGVKKLPAKFENGSTSEITEVFDGYYADESNQVFYVVFYKFEYADPSMNPTYDFNLLSRWDGKNVVYYK